VAKSIWAVGAREARNHAVLLAVLLWTAAAIFVVTGVRSRSAFGPLKGADFVHFYTLGHQARAGQASDLYDRDKQYLTQISLVPQSASDRYLPVYPPQTALVFVPFTLLPYGVAAMAWACLTLTVYALVVRAVWIRSGRGEAMGLLLSPAAIAFPPLWSLVLNGQTTAVPLIAFCGGWLALRNDSRVLAGVAFGLLAIKPQFGLVLAAVVIATLDWRMFIGAASSIAVQMAIVFITLGAEPLRAFATVVRELPTLAPLLEPKPYLLHSIMVVARLLPFSGYIWLAVSAVVTWHVIRVWRSNSPLEIRMAALVLASVLVSPHMTIYDATVLVLPLLWVGDLVTTDPTWQPAAERLGTIVYWLFVTLLIPTALLIKVQLSVLLMLALFWTLASQAKAQPAASLAPELSTGRSVTIR